MESPIIEVSRLGLSLQGKSILKDVNFEIHKAKICAFIGENGAGKTSTIRCIAGLYPPSRGVCNMFGEPSYGMSQRTRNRFGIVLDEGGVYGEMTAWEHMLFFGRLRGLDKPKIADRFKKLAEHFELKSTAPAGRFSKGMKQKLMIIRELLHEPELFILDEPFNGLDPDARIFLRDKLRGISTEQGTSILISSHDLFDIEKIADQVIMIQEGQIVADNTLQEITGNGEQYIVTCKNPSEAARVINEISGMNVVSHNENSVTFTVNSGIVKQPLQTLLDYHIVVEEFFKKKSTLEDFYRKKKKVL